jgi:hypothetical protein
MSAWSIRGARLVSAARRLNDRDVHAGSAINQTLYKKPLYNFQTGLLTLQVTKSGGDPWRSGLNGRSVRELPETGHS